MTGLLWMWLSGSSSLNVALALHSVFVVLDIIHFSVVGYTFVVCAWKELIVGWWGAVPLLYRSGNVVVWGSWVGSVEVGSWRCISW